MRLRVLARLIQIERVLVRHRLDDFVRATHLYRPLRFVFFISPWTWFQRGSNLTRGATVGRGWCSGWDSTGISRAARHHRPA